MNIKQLTNLTKPPLEERGEWQLYLILYQTI